MAFIESQVADHIGTITLGHKEKLNALLRDLGAGIIDALAEFRKESVRFVVLRAKPGVKVWSAGHDVNELPTDRRDPLGWDDPPRYLIRELEIFPAPVIAMMR